MSCSVSVAGRSDHAFLYFAKSLLFWVRKIPAQIFFRPMGMSVRVLLLPDRHYYSKQTVAYCQPPRDLGSSSSPDSQPQMRGAPRKDCFQPVRGPCPGTLGPGVSPNHATAAVLTILADVGCSVGIWTSPKLSAPYRKRRASRTVEMRADPSRGLVFTTGRMSMLTSCPVLEHRFPGENYCKRS
jgi:hypothetical protein